jgi:AbrB family looped-hinge helix DNA binding protein
LGGNVENIHEVLKSLEEKLKELEKWREANYFFEMWLRQHMSSFTVEVGSDGRVTIPAAIRKYYNIGEGDLVKLTIIDVLKRGGKGDRSD